VIGRSSLPKGTLEKKKTANIEILVYGKKYYTNGAGEV